VLWREKLSGPREKVQAKEKPQKTQKDARKKEIPTLLRRGNRFQGGRGSKGSELSNPTREESSLELGQDEACDRREKSVRDNTRAGTGSSGKPRKR